MLRFFLAAVIGSCLVPNSHGADERPLWLVVAAPQFTAELEPLVEHREQQGYRTVVSTSDVPATLVDYPAPDFLLLVGDDQGKQSNSDWHVSTKWQALYKWIETQRDHFATDAILGDLDSDAIPDVSVGRIPARQPSDVATVVAKILQYESSVPAEADLRILGWTGSPMFGPAVDRLATGFSLNLLNQSSPQWADYWLQCADRNHPLFGWPADHTQQFYTAMKRGGCLSLVAAHGWTQGFVSVKDDKHSADYDIDDVTGFDGAKPAPPCFVFTCDSGNFSHPQRCLTEALLFHPAGPVAAIGATTQSHPLTNYYSMRSLLETLDESPATLGELWGNSQRKSFAMRDFLVEPVLKNLEGKLEPAIDVEKLKRDQLHMYALLGDPATKIRLPKPLEARVSKTTDGWKWSVDPPANATRLVVSHRSATPEVPDRPVNSDRSFAQSLQTQANDAMCFQVVHELGSQGPWSGKLQAPGQVRLTAYTPGALHVATFNLKAEK